MTHQCLLTNRALYLLVWNVEDGLPGIESLSIWLQNMQVSCPTPTPVCVGVCVCGRVNILYIIYHTYDDDDVL